MTCTPPVLVPKMQCYIAMPPRNLCNNFSIHKYRWTNFWLSQVPQDIHWISLSSWLVFRDLQQLIVLHQLTTPWWLCFVSWNSYFFPQRQLFSAKWKTCESLVEFSVMHTRESTENQWTSIGTTNLQFPWHERSEHRNRSKIFSFRFQHVRTIS